MVSDGDDEYDDEFDDNEDDGDFDHNEDEDDNDDWEGDEDSLQSDFEKADLCRHRWLNTGMPWAGTYSMDDFSSQVASLVKWGGKAYMTGNNASTAMNWLMLVQCQPRFLQRSVHLTPIKIDA
ncbi:hypothetical protein CRYUN_Cryun07bG0083800 [Craigia yunnanensis]